MAEWLLADVGGTNTRVGLAGAGAVRPDSVRRYRNAAFAGLDDLLAAYLAEAAPGPVARICAAVAGPVREGAAQLTNHRWLIEGARLAAATGAGEVHLINDLQAQGHALDDLPARTLRTLFPGETAPRGAARLVLNIGTGCNIAAVHHRDGGLFVAPAEAGHSPLPHAGGRAGALFDHLRERHPHLPVEAALSGPGLARIHLWLTGARLDPAEIVAAADAGAGDARETLALFGQVLGMVAGGFALHHLPMGGLFLTGGTARAIAPHLPRTPFATAFAARGPYGDILRAIPVRVVDSDGFALAGCARYLRERGGD